MCNERISDMCQFNLLPYFKLGSKVLESALEGRLTF